MLDDFNPKAGDWVLQNAATSAVGKMIIQLAKVRV
jgi:NADPH:quinone reductase-like Zn-dependent oxidoreductase